MVFMAKWVWGAALFEPQLGYNPLIEPPDEECRRELCRTPPLKRMEAPLEASAFRLSVGQQRMPEPEEALALT